MDSPVKIPITSPILVGRTGDIEILTQALQTAAQSIGQCILVAGEAGVGKSRLVAETRRRAEGEGFLTLQGSCFEPDLTFPYAPVIDALRSFFAPRPAAEIAGLLGPLAAELVKLLPELTLTLPDLEPTSSLDPEAEKRRLFEALAQFLTGLTKPSSYQPVLRSPRPKGVGSGAEGFPQVPTTDGNSKELMGTQEVSADIPLLLILEDIHWSDETSLDLLHFFARRLPTFPVLLIASFRREEMTPTLKQTLSLLNRDRLAQEIRLEPLGRAETDAMLQAIFELNRPVRVEFLDTIFALTEGNPFFIEEVVKSLIMAGDIFYTWHGWDRKPIPDLHIPVSVQDAVQQRLAQLSQPARQVLTLAAVAGRRFDFTLLHALTDYDEAELVNLIKEMIAAQFVIEESVEQFAFRHALTRQAIYANLLARERQTLHHTIAQTIERLYPAEETLDRQAADLSYHFYEAGGWEKAIVYGQRAGERAQRMYALNAAIEHFSRALTASANMKQTPPPALYRARADAYTTIGLFEPALRDLNVALKSARAAGDSQLEWELLLELGMLWVSRDYAQAGDYYRQALNLARIIDDPATLGYSLNRLGNYLINLDQPFEAHQYQEEALTIFEQLQAMVRTLLGSKLPVFAL